MLIIPQDHQFQSSKFLLCETETVLKSEIFSSLKLSNFAGWKNILESLWCRYNSIPLRSTQSLILGFRPIINPALFYFYSSFHSSWLLNGWLVCNFTLGLSLHDISWEKILLHCNKLWLPINLEGLNNRDYSISISMSGHSLMLAYYNKESSLKIPCTVINDSQNRPETQ